MRTRSLLVFGIFVSVLAGCSGGPGHAGVYEHEAVAADHPIASEAGAEILRLGGNAVDAAVATSFTLSVVRPYSCGIGGGGFMVIHLQDDERFGTMQTAINYREVAPGAVGPDYYEHQEDPRASRYGAKAVGVPGTVAGLLYALDKYGTMERQAVLAPAIRVAERGFKADAHYANMAREMTGKFEANPQWQERFAFVWERYLLEGDVREGTRIHVPEQARVLRQIAIDGRNGFYRGDVSDAILAVLEQDGGDHTHDDLGAYQVRESDPLRYSFYGHELLGMPPPSSGGIAMAQIFGLLERWRYSGWMYGFSYHTSFEEAIDDAIASSISRAMWAVIPFVQVDDPEVRRAQMMSEAFKHAFSDRARFLGDSAFVDVPVEELLDEEYLDRLAHRAAADRTFGPEYYGAAGLEGEDLPEALATDAGTSHFCVVDRWGSAVSCTETINTEFGSLLAVPEYGFCLNDEMDDFTTKRGQINAYGLRQSDRNLPAPGKRPLSSMSPTIALDQEGQVAALAGGSGGPRIITGTVQVLAPMLLLEERGDPKDVLRWPRLHHQWSPNTLRFEDNQERGAWSFPEQTLDGLRAIGHELKPISNVANVQAIRRNRDGDWEAASDPNKGGRPAGR